MKTDAYRQIFAIDHRFRYTVAFYEEDVELAWVLDPIFCELFDISGLRDKDKLICGYDKATIWGHAYSNRENISYAYVKTMEQLRELDIKVLSNNSKGIDFAILKHLSDKYTDCKIEYEIPETKQRLYDKTGRTMVEIWEQGYRGNRVDVMVGSYRIFAHFPDGDIIMLGMKNQGEPYVKAEDYYRDDIFNLVDYKGFLMLKGDE